MPGHGGGVKDHMQAAPGHRAIKCSAHPLWVTEHGTLLTQNTAAAEIFMSKIKNYSKIQWKWHKIMWSLRLTAVPSVKVVIVVIFCEQMKGNAVGWRNFILHNWDDHHSCHKELWWTHFYSRVDAYGTNSFEIVEASGHPMPRHHLKERGDEGRLQSLQDSTGSKRWEGGFVVRQTSGILRLHTTSSQYA